MTNVVDRERLRSPAAITACRNPRARHAAYFVWIIACLPSATVAQIATFSTLHSFSDASDGSAVQVGNSLIQAADGNLYGVMGSGGTGGGGTIFRSTLTGETTTLYAFPAFVIGGGTGQGPANPTTLVQAKDGTFYGLTDAGGDSGYGIAFKLDGQFHPVPIYSFGPATGGILPHSIVVGSDGNLYGLVIDSGAAAAVYQLTPSGTLTIVHSFDCPCEFAPLPRGYGILTETSPLTFYGESTTPTLTSAVYSVTAAGVVTTVNDFGGTDVSNLINGPAGVFYGTTSSSGGDKLGMIFSLTADGNWTAIHNFTGNGEGSLPDLGPVMAANGTLYGAANGGGTANLSACASTGCGIVYSLNSAGTYKTLYRFSGGADGKTAKALIVGSDGALYGLAIGGGASRDGSLFRISISAEVPTAPAPARGGGGALELSAIALLVALAALQLICSRWRIRAVPRR